MDTHIPKNIPPSRTKTEVSVCFPLPILNATTNDPKARLVRIKVLDRPRMSKNEGTTWTTEEEPVAGLRIGMLVILHTSINESGIGRISAVSDLRQHWVTFTLAGAKNPTHLRTPVIWTILEDLAAFAHSTYFQSLPALPGPPQRTGRGATGHTTAVAHTTADARITWDGEEDTRTRITRITRGSRHG